MEDQIDSLWHEREEYLKAELEPLEDFELDCTCLEAPDCDCPIHYDKEN